MIIQKIEIENFRSYYKSNSFELINGLNLIIGSNGDGKTTLYEALEWLFRTDETNIRSEPLSEYIHIVSVGELGIYKHKSERKYYVSSTQANKPYYDSFGIGLKMFTQDYYMLRVHYMVSKNVWFESFELEIIFRELFGLR